MPPSEGPESATGLANVDASWQRALLGAAGALAYVLLMAMVMEVVPLSLDVRSFGPALAASLVLVFFMPDSPFAAPWNVVVGHLASTVGAIVVVEAAPGASPMLLAGLAVPTAIAAMIAAECLHPPGVVTALLIVLPGPTVVAPEKLFPLLVCLATMAALRAALDCLVDATRRLARGARGHAHSADSLRSQRSTSPRSGSDST